MTAQKATRLRAIHPLLVIAPIPDFELSHWFIKCQFVIGCCILESSLSALVINDVSKEKKSHVSISDVLAFAFCINDI